MGQQFNPGGTYYPERKGFVKALVIAIQKNKKELGTTTPKPKKGK